MRVKEFMELYSDSNFHFMTSKGYLFLNSDQVKSILLQGQKEAAKKELGKGIRADELLAGEVISVSWKSLYKLEKPSQKGAFCKVERSSLWRLQKKPILKRRW